MTQTVVGIFDSQDAAHSAEEALVRRGIERSALHLSTTETSSSGGQSQQQSQGTTGGIRGFFSGLFDTGDKQEGEHYSEAIRRGSVMLAVDVADNAPVEPVCEVLERAGAVDIDQRVEQWRQQGWPGYSSESQPHTSEDIAKDRDTVMPVIQEEIEIGKRQVQKGVVRVFSRTVETPVQETVNLQEEHATIERRPVDRTATPADLNAFDEKSVEVTEMAEKAVVSKSARVVEEVVVGKEVSQSTETIHDTVRHTEVDVDRGTSEGTASTLRPFEDYEPEYRQDFQTRYATQGGNFEDYAPAYRYGHTMASDLRYQGRSWNEIEPTAQLDWERAHPGNSTWERFKMAVQHGWQRVSGQR